MNFKTNARPPIGSGLPTEEKTVALLMASGDQEITPTEGKTMSKVTVTKPATLIAGNIKNGIAIGGVTGTYEGEGGGEPQPTSHRVRFIDYDGTVLKTEYVDTDGDATPPSNPSHTGLTFQEWNNSYEDITADKDIGATYTTADGKVHIYLEIPSFVKNTYIDWRFTSTSGGTIDWGDGTTPESFGTGNLTLTHTYATGGNFEVLIDALQFGFQSYAFNGGSSTNKNYIVKEIRLSTSVTSIGDYAFRSCYVLLRVTIPNSVTSIAQEAFSTCKILAAINIPDSVTSLASFTFYNCSSLTSIVIPDGVTSIRNYMLASCSSLTSIVIPHSVTSIMGEAFTACHNLSSIVIPDSLTSIDTSAFNSCSGLTSIVVTVGNTVYHSEGNCLIRTSNKTLIKGCKNSVIPSDGSVTSIGDSAFYGCRNLTSIVIPDCVTSIKDSAFSSCTGLTSIVIPDGVTSIASFTFRGCTGLTSIVIPDGVTSLKNSLFGGCYGLISIVIPDGVTSIEADAVRGCTGLTSIVIPDGVTSIASFTFYNCSSLTSIVIPDGVTSIEASAFASCSALYAMQIKRDVPPTLANSNAIPNNATLKIYVPWSEDHSILAAYQAATNWSIHAAKMEEYTE